MFQEWARPHSSTLGEGFGRVTDLTFDLVERNPIKVVVTRLKEDVRPRFDGFFCGESREGAVAI